MSGDQSGLPRPAEVAESGLPAPEVALFVGGPLHGTRRKVERDAWSIKTLEYNDHLDFLATDESSYSERVYYRRKLSREDADTRWMQVVWLDARLDPEDPVAMEHVKDAVMLAWFRDGTESKPPVPLY